MLHAGAKISTDGMYRYALWRPVPYTHEVSARPCVFIDLHPTIAGETTDDPIVRKCWGFALRELCGLMVMVNLFAYRTPFTERLAGLNRHVAVGPGNNSALVHYVLKHPIPPLIIACWGSQNWTPYGGRRDLQVLDLLQRHSREPLDIKCFGRNSDGSPRHPLYLPENTPLEPFTAEW